MTYMQYSIDGVYNNFVPGVEQSYTSVCIRHYSKDVEDKKCRMLKRITPVDQYFTFVSNSSS